MLSTELIWFKGSGRIIEFLQNFLYPKQAFELIPHGVRCAGKVGI